MRRLLLRIGVKLMFLIAIVFSIYVLFASIDERDQSPGERSQLLRIRLSDLATNEFQRIPWQSGNLILLRGNAEFPGKLADPRYIFIAFDRGSGLGCPLQWVPPATSAENAPLRPWPGGLRDSCDGTWYDTAGRVFSGQAVTDNLESPAYRLVGELLEIGTNSDNPLPAK
jgi:hypothetical protein